RRSSDLAADLQAGGSLVLNVEAAMGAEEELRLWAEGKLAGASLTGEKGGWRLGEVEGSLRAEFREGGGGLAKPEWEAQLKVGEAEAADVAGADYRLAGEEPVAIELTGRADGSLVGAFEGLRVVGEKEGRHVELTGVGAEFSQRDGEWLARGTGRWQENELPFALRYASGGEAPGGRFEIPVADLREPVSQLGFFVEAAEGLSLSGSAGLWLDFSLGDEGGLALRAKLAEGKLVFPDEGPVLEGIEGGIWLPEVAAGATDFQALRAEKVSAFGLELEGAGLDYRLLAGGGVSLRKVGGRVLGGTFSADPFVLGKGGDFGTILRLRAVDLAQLASLFPDFNGKISGRVDGKLPVARKDGKLKPGHGRMSLTPGRRARLAYDVDGALSGGMKAGSPQHEQMRLVEESLKKLDLERLTMNLFDPREEERALVIRLEGRAPTVKGSPPIILNVNGFKPDDDSLGFFDLLLRHRERLNFGL
ncbi:MAG: intermembrane phospholipid transport protein YdbH family protein, partial [Verrucomicrobiales bacterium]